MVKSSGSMARFECSPGDAMSFATQAIRTIDLMKATPGWSRVKALRPDWDDGMATAIVDEAARFSESVLAPLNAPGDRQGCSLVDGRVRVPAGFIQGFQRQKRLAFQKLQRGSSPRRDVRHPI